MSSSDRTLELASKHRLEIEKIGGGEEIRLVAPDGAVPVTIEVTAEGVVLRLGSVNVALRAAKDLSISAEHLILEGRSGVEVASGRDLELDVGGDLRSTAQQQFIRAERGSVDVHASDDVKLAGERVLVNCDETVDRYYRKPG
jgi:hypothetical protein